MKKEKSFQKKTPISRKRMDDKSVQAVCVKLGKGKREGWKRQNRKREEKDRVID